MGVFYDWFLEFNYLKYFPLSVSFSRIKKILSVFYVVGVEMDLYFFKKRAEAV